MNEFPIYNLFIYLLILFPHSPTQRSCIDAKFLQLLVPTYDFDWESKLVGIEDIVSKNFYSKK